MNWDRVEGNWMQLKGRIKQKWGMLANNPRVEAWGERDQLLGSIQETHGICQEETRKRLSDWRKRQNAVDQIRRNGAVQGAISNARLSSIKIRRFSVLLRFTRCATWRQGKTRLPPTSG